MNGYQYIGSTHIRKNSTNFTYHGLHIHPYSYELGSKQENPMN